LRNISSQVTAALAAMPAPGSGVYHTNLLRVANLGIAAGVAPADLVRAIRAATPRGSRVVPDSEIQAAVDKAASEIKPGQRLHWRPLVAVKPAVPTIDAGKFLRGLLAGGADATVEDLRDLSPCLIEYGSHAVQVLDALYAPADRLFNGDIGCARETDIQPVHEWMARCKAGQTLRPLIIPNPLTGQLGLKKDGGLSYRCDACVTKFRFAVAEFDKVPPALREPGVTVGPWPFGEQARFWAGAIATGWPVAALIHSGGKSIHAWLAVDAADAQEWERNVEQGLFGELLVPIGVDSACKNESRLSRMPGAFRADKGQWQRLLYLNPNAGGVVT
jgi:hypothetical protein